MTWIGRSSHCASSIATSDEISSAREHDGHRPLQRVAQLGADQQRGDADPDRPELLIAGEQRLAHLEGLIGVDRLQLRERPGLDDLG